MSDPSTSSHVTPKAKTITSQLLKYTLEITKHRFVIFGNSCSGTIKPFDLFLQIVGETASRAKNNNLNASHS